MQNQTEAESKNKRDKPQSKQNVGLKSKLIFALSTIKIEKCNKSQKSLVERPKLSNKVVKYDRDEKSNGENGKTWKLVC